MVTPQKKRSRLKPWHWAPYVFISPFFILFALEYWNNLLWPLIVFLQKENFPLAVGLAGMINTYQVQYDLLLAGSALATVPIIALFFILRRQFMEGASFTGTGVQ